MLVLCGHTRWHHSHSNFYMLYVYLVTASVYVGCHITQTRKVLTRSHSSDTCTNASMWCLNSDVLDISLRVIKNYISMAKTLQFTIRCGHKYFINKLSIKFKIFSTNP